MTPFEYAVIALMMLFCVTNMCKLVSNTKLHTLPKDYLHLVFAFCIFAGIAVLNLAAHIIIGE